MRKLFTRSLRKVVSLFAIFTLLFQNFAPVAVLGMQVYAQAAPADSPVSIDPKNVSLNFDETAHKFKLAVKSEQAQEYLITYESDGIKDGAQGTLSVDQGVASKDIFAGSCSGEDCLAQEVTQGSLELPGTNYQANFEVKNGQTWLTTGNLAVVSDLKVGQTYVAPQNSEVEVTFSELPANPGNLYIEQVELSDEQVAALGAYSKVAYDISSDMANGTFKFDLKLPLPEGANSNAKVKFAEKVEDLVGAQEVDSVQVDEEKGEVRVPSLDHFTVFVVTNPPLVLDQIIDNSDPNFSILSGSWRNSTSVSGYYGSNYVTTDERAGSEQVQWSFSVPENGDYEVMARWTSSSNRGTNVPFTIFHKNGSSTVEVNQEINGGAWNTLGTFRFKKNNTYQVVLTNNATDSSNYVIADAIQVRAVDAPDNVWVDDDWSGSAGDVVGTDKIFGWNAFNKIQDAVDAVKEGGTVKVANGNYEEQVVIDKKLSLIGNNKDKVILTSPVSLSYFYNSPGNKNYPIIGVHDASNVLIKKMTIDGAGRGNSNYRFIGVAFYNASGEADTLNIKNIEDTPLSGSQHGVGFYAYSDDSNARDIALNNSSIFDYQKNGVVFSGSGINAQVLNNVVTGSGPLDLGLAAQNGVQFSGGVTGLIQDNKISNNKYLPATWAATGILLSGAGDNVQIINNELFNNGPEALYVYASGSNILIKGNNVHDNTGDGIVVYGAAHSGITIEDNTIKDNEYGMWIGDLFDESGRIFNNTFINVLNAADSGAHYWDNGSNRGNSWGDYTGVDLNNDGIGEVPYKIDDDSEDRYPLADYLSVNVNSVNLSSDFYKKNDEVKIDVQLTNNGDLPLQSGHENLVVNIKGPSGWISGSFRESRGVDLAVGETKTYSFYSTSQFVPETWVEGTYTVYTSVYTNRDSSLGYLPGGQSSNTTFVVDNTAPSKPTNLRRLGADGQEYTCSDLSKRQNMVPMWDEYTGSDFDHYEYSSFNADTHQGLNEQILYQAKFPNTWVAPEDGTYGFAVRTVDKAGNKSDWAETDETWAGSCQITYDSVPPEVPHDLKFLNPDVQCGGYTTSHNITVDWADSFDATSGLDHYNYNINYPLPNGLRGSWDTERPVSQYSGSLNEGRHDVKLQAVDKVGNKSEWSEICSITADWTAPESFITTYGTATEEVTLAGTEEANGESYQTPSFSGYVAGTATDHNGSGVDHVLLSISHLGFEDGATEEFWDATASGTGAWSSTNSMFRADGSDPENWSYQLPENGIVEGIYQVTSHAVDKAGNVEHTYTVKIIYDKTIPEVSVTIDPATPDGLNGWYWTKPTLYLHGNDNYQLDRIEYQWDSTSDSGWITYVDGTGLTPPGEGQHLLHYRGVDEVGNTAIGTKVVLYDATNPSDGPLNVRVDSITSNSAMGHWDEPDNAGDITHYDLVWSNNETGDSHGKTVGRDDFDEELTDLFDGEWTFTVKAMDDAGHFKEASTTFRVGAAPGGANDGQVLGATTDQTGLGGVITRLFGGNSQANNQNEEEAQNQETTAPTDEGEVLGTSDYFCTGWKFYLPFILLILQVIVVTALEFVNRKNIRMALLMALLATIATSLLYYLLRDGQCFSNDSFLSLINRWFIVISVLLSTFISAIFYAFVPTED